MKVIFLDIDGVLNTRHSMVEPPIYYGGIDSPECSFNVFDKRCVDRINKITDVTGAVLVISSTWRILCERYDTFELLIQHFEFQGVTGKIIGYTPIRDDGMRDLEVEEFIKDIKEELNQDIENYIIIDDDLSFFTTDENGWPRALSKIVLCLGGWEWGIQEEQVADAICLLNS